MTRLTRQDVAAAVAERADGVVVRLRVVPRAPRTGLVGRYAQALKLKVKAPPVEGAANAEVVRFLADACRVRAGEVSLLQGERSRDKVYLVRGRTAAEVIDALLRAAF